MAKVIVIGTFDDHHLFDLGEFYITDGHYRMTKAQVRAAFKLFENSDEVGYAEVDGEVKTNTSWETLPTWEPYSWIVDVNIQGGLSIGCMWFDKKTTETLRKWAEGKKPAKKAAKKKKAVKKAAKKGK